MSRKGEKSSCWICGDCSMLVYCGSAPTLCSHTCVYHVVLVQGQTNSAFICIMNKGTKEACVIGVPLITLHENSLTYPDSKSPRLNLHPHCTFVSRMAYKHCRSSYNAGDFNVWVTVCVNKFIFFFFLKGQCYKLLLLSVIFAASVVRFKPTSALKKLLAGIQHPFTIQNKNIRLNRYPFRWPLK